MQTIDPSRAAARRSTAPGRPAAPAVADTLPQLWRAAALGVLDDMAAARDADARDGTATITVRREHWDALMALRGTPDEILARRYQREAQGAFGRAGTPTHNRNRPGR